MLFDNGTGIRQKHLGILFGLLFLLCACGFHPLYQELANEAEQDISGAIYIAPVDGRVGQVVRNFLLEHLSKSSDLDNQGLVLTVNLDTKKLPVAFKSDRTVTRFNVVMEAIFSLVERDSGKKLAGGEVRSIAAYSVVLSEFANISAAQNAERRAALDISQEIARQVAIYRSNIPQD